MDGADSGFKSKIDSTDYHDEMNTEHYIEWFTQQLLSKGDTLVQHETKVDPILSKVLPCTKCRWPSQIQKELEPYKN